MEDQFAENREERFLPIVTIVLVGVNVMLFFLCKVFGNAIYSTGMLYPSAVLQGHRFYQLFSSMFLHAGIGHLVNNMLLLAVGGELVERTIGPYRYLSLYLLSGLAGNIAYLCYEMLRRESIPSLGASGAIFGLLGALLILVVLNKGRFQGISLRRMLFMLAYSFISGTVNPNVNQLAHIGGFLAGALLMGVMQVKNLSQEANPYDHWGNTD
ncbi:MAG: rhomboid family intramembrane serine protease [Lachnospiraceae bacterium]|nr:rhomboid family intramembrane serine protease [Lachnospiraceae bacterium]